MRRERSRSREGVMQERRELRNDSERRLSIHIVAITTRWDTVERRNMVRRRLLDILGFYDGWRPNVNWARRHREMTDFWVLVDHPEPNTFSYFVHDIHPDRFEVHVIGPTEYLREWFFGRGDRPLGGWPDVENTYPQTERS